MNVFDRLSHAWNAFRSEDEKRSGPFTGYYGPSASIPAHRTIVPWANEGGIVEAILTRIAVDCAQYDFRHVRLDDKGRYLEDIQSGLNNCLTLEANIDQTATPFMQDVVYTMLSDGYLAINPIDTVLNPELQATDILTMRVGQIVEWHPEYVRCKTYRDKTGEKEDLVQSKKVAAVVYNPLYNVMNKPSSTLKRLTRKLRLLDQIDENNGSSKLDLIVALPYNVKSETKREQASQRMTDIKNQLATSDLGIAYVDGTEKITQLNRPVESNLLPQIQYLMELLYSQLGITPDIMNGTADEAAMINYRNRTIEPILTAIQESMKRTFLSKTARTQRQSVEYFIDVFKLMPLSEIAEVADKLTRNEIVSSNEVRQGIGMKPSTDPKADELRNSNMPQSELGVEAPAEDGEDTAVQDAFDDINATLDGIFADLGADEDGT